MNWRKKSAVNRENSCESPTVETYALDLGALTDQVEVRLQAARVRVVVGTKQRKLGQLHGRGRKRIVTHEMAPQTGEIKA